MKKLGTCISVLAVVAAALSIPLPVSAHSFPDKETPSAGQRVTSPPSQVVVHFDAPIEKLFSKLEVTGPDGKNEAMGAPEVSDDGRELSIKVGVLKPGDYQVKWAVVCIDTHHTQGSYTFSIANGGS